MAKDPDRDLIDKMNSALTDDIRNTLRKVLVVELKPILITLQSIKGRLDILEKRVDSVEKELKKQGRAVNKLQKTMNSALRLFDNADVRIYKRVRRIEDHLRLPRFE